MMISNPLAAQDFSGKTELVEHAYEIFYNTLGSKENRTNFKDYTLFVNMRDWVNDKPDIFWHIVGLEDNADLTIYPCINDSLQLFCNSNCDSHEWRVVTIGKERVVCVYRAARMRWIDEIMKLANADSQSIKTWINRNRVFIRFQNGLSDYVIILEKMEKYQRTLKFVTAYPVFYRRQKKAFDRDYDSYTKSEAARK